MINLKEFEYNGFIFDYYCMNNNSIFITSMEQLNQNKDISAIKFPSYIENKPVIYLNYNIFVESAINMFNIKYIELPDHSPILPNCINYFHNLLIIKYFGIIICKNKIKNIQPQCHNSYIIKYKVL